jgi:hypothetical protein
VHKGEDELKKLPARVIGLEGTLMQQQAQSVEQLNAQAA